MPPPHEAERLAALRSSPILDALLEPGFDRITAMAARLSGAPIAVIAFVDGNREWFKSVVGLEMQPSIRWELFSAEAMLSAGPMVIPDVRDDPRFAGDLLVTDAPCIQACAGVPLKTESGLILGALCVMDMRARDFQPEEIRALVDLAAIVTEKIEAGVASRRLREEIDEHQKVQVHLGVLATLDPLTGMHNRSQLPMAMERAIAAAREGRHGAIFYIDLDGFKLVNDTLGHGAGDRLLVQIAEALQSCVRDDDKIVRFGGDEFVVVLEDTGALAAASIAGRIRKRLEDFQFKESGKSFNVAASLGVARIDGGMDSEQLLSAADTACYVAKAHGGNRVEVYCGPSDELDRLRKETNLAGRIREALTEHRLQLWIQPIQALESGKILFHEGLLRLLENDGRILTAQSFMHAAVRFRLMDVIDRYVIKEAVRHLAVRPDLRLCINLSAQTLMDMTLPGCVAELVEREGIGRGRLNFEITETEMVANMSTARQTIAALREMGCRFALDDFGTGVSSFAYLKTLPIDFLKIDGSFVRDLAGEVPNQTFVRAINMIAHALDLETIAESVEDERVLDTVRKIGVDYAQGYYIGRPAPVASPVEAAKAP